MIRILVVQPADSRGLRRLWRLLRRHSVLAVAVVVELDEPRAAGALAKAYNARPVQLPPELLLVDAGVKL